MGLSSSLLEQEVQRGWRTFVQGRKERRKGKRGREGERERGREGEGERERRREGEKERVVGSADNLNIHPNEQVSFLLEKNIDVDFISGGWSCWSKCYNQWYDRTCYLENISRMFPLLLLLLPSPPPLFSLLSLFAFFSSSPSSNHNIQDDLMPLLPWQQDWCFDKEKVNLEGKKRIEGGRGRGRGRMEDGEGRRGVDEREGRREYYVATLLERRRNVVLIIKLW